MDRLFSAPCGVDDFSFQYRGVVMSLFADSERENLQSVMPLSARMRPRSLEEFAGQSHFLGEGKLLRRLIAADRLGSVIFYGPPGTGKTSLARLLATLVDARYEQLSAVTSGVKELREVLSAARDEVATGGRRTLLFVDEIHRFNKSQQDVLLHDVEDGIVILVGATTANPYFSVNSALISRSQVFQFEPLSIDQTVDLIGRALTDRERGLGSIDVRPQEGALEYLAASADGDARRALHALETAVLSSGDDPVMLTRELAAESVQQKALLYDADGDQHYDVTSALIKSIRGSDPDASLYWLARMLESGEDVQFVTRRLVILASEDIGNADPHALSLAVAAMQACEFIGLPECQLTLAQAVTYLACAPKSNASTLAISNALKDVRDGVLLRVPAHLRDSHYAGARKMGHGKGYVYAHDADDGVAAQDYLGVEKEYYQPVDRGFESTIRLRLKAIRQTLRGHAHDDDPQCQS